MKQKFRSFLIKLKFLQFISKKNFRISACNFSAFRILLSKKVKFPRFSILCRIFFPHFRMQNSRIPHFRFRVLVPAKYFIKIVFFFFNLYLLLF